jgi:hydrogenase nickel incorporation protein HypA/HybF
MHELYATQAVLEKALKKAEEAKATRITEGTIAEGSQLHFHHVAAEMQCMACFTKYHSELGEILCPSCGSTGAKIIAGEEFFMEALDVE